MLRYGRHFLDEADIEGVVEVLRSEWITTGPKGPEFEESFARFVGARQAVAVSSGTAALHASMHALGIGPGDEVIVPAMTFAATANCVVFQGAEPVFADVEPETLLLGPAQAEERITPRTKALLAVDYAGQPCDYDGLRALAARRGLALVADACHALGATYKGRAVGGLADLNSFSLHPVKHITTGEGGIVTTDDGALAKGMRSFRNHGINNDCHQREAQASWFYEVEELGHNYRLTDFQCAMGLSQLGKLPSWVARRRQIARSYDTALSEMPAVRPLVLRPYVEHAYHLYVARLEPGSLSADRTSVFRALRAEGIGVNVHYIPVHLHPFYRERFGTGPGLCPAAEAAYEEVISLPIFPAMSEADVEDVVEALKKVLNTFSRTWSYHVV
jgi:perosamine synthetase